MPTIAHDRAQAIAEALLKGAGCNDHEAAVVAKGCVGANLAGHDSHGIIAIPTYIDRGEARPYRAECALRGGKRIR